MFWTIIERISLLLGTVLVAKQVADIFSDINPNSIYSPEEIATILRVEKVDVMELIHRGKLKALKNNNQYRVLGRNLIDSLSAGTDGDSILDFYSRELMFQSRLN